MENMVNLNKFWQGKKVFITGHTGFKGAWLSLWLQQLGAEVIGFSLAAPTDPNLFTIAHVEQNMHSIIGDIRDYSALQQAVEMHQPEVMFHLAAQSLVRTSYDNPIETYATNVMGTLHVLEAIRSIKSVRAAVMVTSDKCYENKEWCWGYRENEPMGGYDPYSSSKGCAEILISSYRRSYFSDNKNKVAIATARAGNVIGGGDWAKNRLIPEVLTAFQQGKKAIIRSPHAIRPWQHVLEPLAGYLLLAQRLYQEEERFAEAWNFGPHDIDAKSVAWIVSELKELWGKNADWEIEPVTDLHEAHYLKLDCSKARSQLNWQPKWPLKSALKKTVDWYIAFAELTDIKQFTLKQIQEYMDAY